MHNCRAAFARVRDKRIACLDPACRLAELAKHGERERESEAEVMAALQSKLVTWQNKYAAAVRAADELRDTKEELRVLRTKIQVAPEPRTLNPESRTRHPEL